MEEAILALDDGHGALAVIWTLWRWGERGLERGATGNCDG